MVLRDRLAAGLAEAHRKGAVHRDISPDNVILPGERIESAKLIDFGISKLTDPSQGTIVGSSFAGKLGYASPEQLGLYGGAVDGRSDIYSLGLILGAAAQGHPLPMGETYEEVRRSRQGVPDLIGVPESLRDWLAAMLAPDPAKRPATLEMLLERWPAAESRLIERQSSRDKGRRWVWTLALVLLAGACGGLYWLLRPLPVDGPLSDSDGNPPAQVETAESKADSVTAPSQDSSNEIPIPDLPAISSIDIPPMVTLASGCFEMGAKDDPERYHDETSHHVCLQLFAISRYEVSVGEFRRFIEATGSNRSRMGVRGTCRNLDTILLGRCTRSEPRKLSGLRLLRPTSLTGNNGRRLSLHGRSRSGVASK